MSEDMTTGCYDEFLKALQNYPSQDNQGFIPDRGGFKCGWFSCWHYHERKTKRLEHALSKTHSNWEEIAKENEHLKGLLTRIVNIGSEYKQSLHNSDVWNGSGDTSL